MKLNLLLFSVLILSLTINLHHTYKQNKTVIDFVTTNQDFIQSLSIDDYNEIVIAGVTYHMLKSEPDYPIPYNSYYWTDINKFNKWRISQIELNNEILNIYKGFNVFIPHDLAEIKSVISHYND